MFFIFANLHYFVFRRSHSISSSLNFLITCVVASTFQLFVIIKKKKKMIPKRDLLSWVDSFFTCCVLLLDRRHGSEVYSWLNKTLSYRYPSREPTLYGLRCFFKAWRKLEFDVLVDIFVASKQEVFDSHRLIIAGTVCLLIRWPCVWNVCPRRSRRETISSFESEAGQKVLSTQILRNLFVYRICCHCKFYLDNMRSPNMFI